MADGQIRVAKFQVCGCDGHEWRDLYRELRELADTMKRATNLIWRTWMQWHADNGSADVLGPWMQALREWHAAIREREAWMAQMKQWKDWPNNGKTGARPAKPAGTKPAKPTKPRCPLFAVPPACAKTIYRAIHDAFPQVHNRPLELQRNVTEKRIKSLKPFSGAFPGWMRVLLNDDRPPFSSKPVAIPFDKAHTAIEHSGKEWRLVVRLHRRLQGKSEPLRLILRTNGKHCAGERAKLERVARGEYPLKGSRLAFHASDGKWYANICYAQPATEKLAVDPNRVAYLQPAADRPWHFWVDGYPYYLGGRTGKHVGAVRCSILSQQWGRREGYRVASSAGKGHGRQRALNHKLNQLRRRWQDFVKTQNEAVVRDVLRLCEDRQIGRVVYYQPTGRVAERRFLTRAGKIRGRRDASSWDWYQLGALLQRKCDEKGIDVEVCKYGAAKTRETAHDQVIVT